MNNNDQKDIPLPWTFQLLRNMGMKRLAWKLRRLYVPIPSDALVLDIGSGGNPYPRANVLLDAYEETVERTHGPLVKDRPIVLGLAEHLPFRDKAFDFIIASHVLEHSPDPEAFLAEIVRVGKGGYIETPEAFFERINPFIYHRLEVGRCNSKLLIFKKASWRHDKDVVDLYENKLKTDEFVKFTRQHPELFHTRFYWADEIDYEIVNPQVDITWPIPDWPRSPKSANTKERIRRLLIEMVRFFFSQRTRNRGIDLMQLLMCPACRSDSLSSVQSRIVCNKCKITYPVRNGTPVLYPPTPDKTP
jgi:uncharacterized protein YbaR (Trm112 family)